MNKGYISKKKAIDELDYAYMHCADIDRYGLSTALDVIDEIETADVIPVVRCKDCEWAMKSTELPGWYMCKCEEAFDYYAKPNDFCSYGKKREEEDE